MRRGSALLIVLGMMSFLVVSAIAFSAYMRRSRQPSSYLVRTSTSRNLVKAGLARALADLEEILGDNPHPGIGDGNRKTEGDNDDSNCRNWWCNRVLMAGANAGDRANTRYTVSTLSLEGLAHLPPRLINEVRRYARHSYTAVPQDLGFDSGRYAFTVVDVSDFFDVNRVKAAPEGGGRTSAADARVTLAYLFENRSHSGWAVDPEDWDDFVTKWTGDASKPPFISWADLNLAINADPPKGFQSGGHGFRSPWCDYLTKGTLFVQDNDDDRHALSNMVFVTDSWYPEPARNPAAAKPQLDLASDANQPFRAAMKMQDPNGYAGRGADRIFQQANPATDFYDEQTGANTKWSALFAPPELLQLADYLDADSVPTSVAWPTAERAPMVTGVSLIQCPLKVSVASGGYQTDPVTDASGTYCYDVKTYTLKVDASALIASVGLAYPFKYKHGNRPEYDVQGFATIVFVGKDPANLRPGESNWATAPDWQMSKKQAKLGVFDKAVNPQKLPSGLMIASEVVTVPGNGVTIPDEVGTRSQAVLDDCPLNFGSISPTELAVELAENANGIQGLKKETCSLRVSQKMVQVTVNGNTTWQKSSDPPVKEFGTLLANSLVCDNAAVAPSDGAEFQPTVQLWVRVTEKGKSAALVDLVPACAADDVQPSALLADSACAKNRSVVRFQDAAAAAKVTYKGDALTANGTMTPAPAAYVADDPRFNFAPEDLVAVNNLEGGNRAIGDKWLEIQRSGASDRDGDVFMATSDAGYLQSKYELAHLLDFSDFNGTAQFGCLDGAYDGKVRTAAGSGPSSGVMWNTYDVVRVGKFNVVSGKGGTRVCPYTPDTTVMMGAFANTPYDWWAAGTNENVSTEKQTMLSDIDKAVQHTFSERSDCSKAQVKWEELEAVSRLFRDKFRAGSGTLDDRFADAFDFGPESPRSPKDDVSDDDFGTFGKVELDTACLHSVDRKYLYGFWRECFETRQQLFLVFVRAEPILMGGEQTGRMPPMLGARSVALVWRDPEKPPSGGPHRMRVLYYRQCE